MVEAKSRDVNPSSLTGAKLISQELLNDYSLLAHAQRQEQRLSFFVQNKSAFEELLGPLRAWTTYAVRSFIWIFGGWAKTINKSLTWRWNPGSALMTPVIYISPGHWGSQ